MSIQRSYRPPSPASWLVLAARGLSALLVLAWGSSLGSQPVRAQEDDPDKALLTVERIEITLFSGYMGGATYLELPELFSETQTFDTGADLITDFSGQGQPLLRAPRKKIENGYAVGGTASFFLSRHFGFQLFGSYSSMDATLTGHPPNDLDRFEQDRSSMSIVRGGGNIIYQIGREEKLPIRPYFNLGFGGLLNRFPEVDDVSALYFLYGGGVSIPLVGGFRAQLGLDFTLYSFDTEEIALASTITLPSVTLGITWRHMVPEEEVDPLFEDEDDGLTTPVEGAGEGGL